MPVGHDPGLGNRQRHLYFGSKLTESGEIPVVLTHVPSRQVSAPDSKNAPAALVEGDLNRRLDRMRYRGRARSRKLRSPACARAREGFGELFIRTTLSAADFIDSPANEGYIDNKSAVKLPGLN